MNILERQSSSYCTCSSDKFVTTLEYRTVVDWVQDRSKNRRGGNSSIKQRKRETRRTERGKVKRPVRLTAFAPGAVTGEICVYMLCALFAIHASSAATPPIPVTPSALRVTLGRLIMGEGIEIVWAKNVIRGPAVE